MSLYHRLKAWVAFPDLDLSSYECSACDRLLTSERAVCPECGGEVTVVEPDPTIYYWDPMD